MRSVHAAKFRLAGRRICFEIAAHVARRQAVRAQTGNLKMGKVLANAAELREYVGKRRADRRGGRVEREVLLNATGEVGHGVEDRASRRERSFCVIGELRLDWHQWRWVSEFVRLQGLAGIIFATTDAHDFPGWS